MINRHFFTAFFLALATILLFKPAEAQNRFADDKSHATRSNVIAQNGMVTSSHPIASDVGLQILKSGGNAIDAAIAANAIMTLADPGNNGIGGDLFVILWSAEDERLYGLNASGRAPAGLTRQHFEDKGLDRVPLHGHKSITVPGTVDGWFELNRRFGSLDMSALLEPTIHYAKEGVPIPEWIANNWGAPSIAHEDPYFRRTFLPNGESPQVGDLFRNPDLAETYRLIADQGRDVFYEGEIAERIVRYMKDAGGFLRMEDLKAHTSEWIEPRSISYRDYDVWQLPPNGQGIAALQILGILEQKPVAEWGFGSADYLHHFAEAKKLAYEDMSRYYADPQKVEVPVSELISIDYARERAGLIDPDQAADAYPTGTFQADHTIYLATADRHGNMVSLIQSNAGRMGSGIAPEGLGFVLQNRGSGFSLQENHLNRYEPGKRPFHTIIPGFVTKDDRPVLALGVMGGYMQPQGQAQILINMIDFGMSPQEAGDAPRIEHQGSSTPQGDRMKEGGELRIQTGIDMEAVEQLEAKGHTIGYRGLDFFGGYQAIWRHPETGLYWGASEWRQDGQAAGY